MNRFQAIQYTLKHKVAFHKKEKQLLGYNTIRGYIHDLDKIFLYLILGKNKGSKLHRQYAWHHEKNAKTKKDYIEMVIDWECARYTKPDKPLNAYDTLYKFHPELENQILPILKEFKIDKSLSQKGN